MFDSTLPFLTENSSSTNLAQYVSLLLSLICDNQISPLYKSNTVLNCSNSRIPMRIFQKKNFVPADIELLNIIISKNKEEIGTIERRVVDSSDSEIIVDQKNELSSTKESVCFLNLLFVQTDLLLELKILDVLVQG